MTRDEIEEWRKIDDSKGDIKQDYWQALVYIDYLLSECKRLENEYLKVIRVTQAFRDY